MARTARSFFAPRWSWVTRSRRGDEPAVERLVDRAAQRLERRDGGEVDDRLHRGRDGDAHVHRAVECRRARCVLMPRVPLDRRRDHVGVALEGLEQAPEQRRGAVRKRGVGAARLDGREAPGLQWNVRVTHGVNTPIKGEQRAVAHAREDRALASGRRRGDRRESTTPHWRAATLCHASVRVRFRVSGNVNARVAWANHRAGRSLRIYARLQQLCADFVAHGELHQSVASAGRIDGPRPRGTSSDAPMAIAPATAENANAVV